MPVSNVVTYVVPVPDPSSFRGAEAPFRAAFRAAPPLFSPALRAGLAFCARSRSSGSAPPATSHKYRLATLQYGLNQRRYLSKSFRVILRW